MADSAPQRYTITAALPYTNGPVHIGHLAGVYVPADIYARYLRKQNRKVAFICGSDEHGVAITLRARKDGRTPQQVVDQYHEQIKTAFERFGISFDIYHRTSEPLHHQTASEMFKALYDNGKFIEQTTDQFYDEEQQQFLADRYIKGECPVCGYQEAYGDQCENCGTSLSPSELKNPKSTLSGNPPVKRQTKHWYFPLNEYEDFFRQWILEGHKDDWKANVYGQCKSWIDQGLQPRAMTRDLDWGVKVPLPGAEGKVMYVWFDAPIGYISATKAWAEQKGEDWEPYWKDKGTKLVHFIGKDNIVFHCLIFPALLHAHGDYILPDNVPANEFMNLEGSKISTSRNWAVWLHEFLDEFPDKEDVLRYTLTANAPETKDNDFSWKDFQTKNKSELLDILGNFINRIMVLTHKHFEGQVPQEGTHYDLEAEVKQKIAETPTVVAAALERYKFREAQSLMMELARCGNKYLTDTEPWKLVKTDKGRVATIIGLSLQIAANLCIVMEPFLPFTAAKLRSMLNIEAMGWGQAGNAALIPAGHALGQTQLLFQKIEDATIEQQLAKLQQAKQEKQMEQAKIQPQKDTMTFDEFMKVDMRIGTVLEAEKVKKSKKLLKLLIDTGIDKRTIVSGIAAHYTPEDMVGRQVTVLVNLAPRKIMGIESQGMLLMAEDADESLKLIAPIADTTNGSPIS